jgi:hypothetical protein
MLFNFLSLRRRPSLQGVLSGMDAGKLAEIEALTNSKFTRNDAYVLFGTLLPSRGDYHRVADAYIADLIRRGTHRAVAEYGATYFVKSERGDLRHTQPPPRPEPSVS